MPRPTALLFVPLALAACGDDAPAPPPAMDASVPVDRPDASVPVDAGPFKGAASVSVRHYDYAIDLATRAVESRLTLRVERAGDCLTIGFRHPAADSVTFDGVPARDVMVANGTLLACDGARRGWAVGREVTLAVTSTEPLTTMRPTQVGYSVRTNAAGQRFTYLLSWVGECARHGPCDATPSLFATYRFTVTHPEDTRVYCPGEIQREAARTVCTFTRPGGPTYSTFGVAAMSGNGWTESSLGESRGVRVTLVDTATSGTARAVSAEYVRGFLDWMQTTFGAYPYGNELRIIVAPTYWAGFEHPGSITIAETLAAGGRVEHTILHEIAHQWAGDQTTLAATRDFAWKESMAEYLAYVYEDQTHTRDEATSSLATWKLSASRATRYAVPDEDLPLVDWYGSAYGPGPMVLFRQTEVRFGRERVLAALRMLLGRERALSMDDVQRALEQSTGAQLGEYIRAWLHGTGAPVWPAVRVVRETVGSGVRVTVSATTRDGVRRPCRFRVRLTGEGGQMLDVPVDFGLDGSQPAPVTVTPDFTVTGEVIDPLQEALVFPEMPAGGMIVRPWPDADYNPFRAPLPLPGREVWR